MTKLKVVANVAGFVLALVARKKMADKGMVRSFWYGLPHKPGTFNIGGNDMLSKERTIAMKMYMTGDYEGVERYVANIYGWSNEEIDKGEVLIRGTKEAAKRCLKELR